MRKPAVLLLLLVVTAADPSPAATSEVAVRVEQAVVSGNLETLESIRTSLLQEMKTGTSDALRYDIAYVGWRMAQLLQVSSKKKAKQLLKESQAYVDDILEGNKDDGEAWALRGSVIGDRITGMFSAMFLGPKAGGSLKRAVELAPDNPRVALQRGIGWFFTPKTFGGGMENAEGELRRAARLFDEAPAGGPWPDWGRVDVLVWLGQVLVKTGRYAEARSNYEAALKIEPDYAWIKQELMPTLEKLETSDPSSQS